MFSWVFPCSPGFSWIFLDFPVFSFVLLCPPGINFVLLCPPGFSCNLLCLLLFASVLLGRPGLSTSLFSRFLKCYQGFLISFQVFKGFSGVSPRFISNLVISRTLSMSNSLFSFGSIAWSLKGRNGQAEQALGLKKGGLVFVNPPLQTANCLVLSSYVLLCSVKLHQPKLYMYILAK